mmetsp:Transcript_34609/g.136496  ORF Transcript_34609/g.136496 Transcript_34609/m.136496 type:complete len:493 (-) Transcript_34609:352-1830(-)|eukprot:CAMPEP_0113963164 /NCGR_PEP_ID=MMETSP0011_2-20120614/6348_1 /TAXON_ID=101924 /ORGANISM="Rhodosorus marinus" /LENGTH=492 /DNA_ID=CAMNT_0000975157 /DNA_START=201 /DNA_END=1679 /DNA_ORIENTATION=- /assembly_acc=CAM_ASM_000156
MKSWGVLILLLGFFRLSYGEVKTCADFFNPLLSAITPEQACFDLDVQGDIVGSVQSSGHVKKQGPNSGELCIRFEFSVRDGLGIKRAKVGVWAQGVPLNKSRFTRKRRFADEPNMVRVDVCLDDIVSNRDCCMDTKISPALVLEARVRMEDGIVRTAGLVPFVSVQPTRLQVRKIARQLENGLCSRISQTDRACDSLSSEEGKAFWACKMDVTCDFFGGFPRFVGINRVDMEQGRIQAVAEPVADIDPESLELSIYEIPTAMVTPPPPGGAYSAEALTVISRRPATARIDPGGAMEAEFSVPELIGADGPPRIDTATTVGIAIALHVRVKAQTDNRLAVRAVADSGRTFLLDFVSFGNYAFLATGDGPVENGLVSKDSLFGPLPTSGVVGRIASVICGFCYDEEVPVSLRRTEWILTPGRGPVPDFPSPPPLPLPLYNRYQFSSTRARLPGQCLSFLLETPKAVRIGARCADVGTSFRVDRIIEGQVICTCQ